MVQVMRGLLWCLLHITASECSKAHVPYPIGLAILPWDQSGGFDFFS